MYLKIVSSEDASNLSNQLKQGNWLVLYHADWCGHCQQMKPEWSKVINQFTGSANNINIAEIESAHIPSMIKPPTIQGYPTIKMYNSGNEVSEYNGARISDDIAKFALSNNKSNSNNLSSRNSSRNASRNSSRNSSRTASRLLNLFKNISKTHKSKKTTKSKRVATKH